MLPNNMHRLLALLLALALMVSCVYAESDQDTPSSASAADESEAADTPAPTPAPTPVPEGPTAAPATHAPTDVPETTSEPEITPAPDTTDEPEVTPVPEATEEPEVTPVPEATEEPEVTPVTDPTDEPEVTPAPDTTDIPETTPAPDTTDIPETTPVPDTTDEPEVTPAPAITLTLVPEDDNAEQDENNVWTVKVNVHDLELKLKWACSEQAASYRLIALDMQEEQLCKADAYGEHGILVLPEEALGQQITVLLIARDAQGSQLAMTQISIRTVAVGQPVKTPAPTDAPEAAVTPAPTDAPEATATPVPTDVPEATETPGPTEMPNRPGKPSWPSGSGIPGNWGGSFNWGSMGSQSSSGGIVPGRGLGSGHADGDGSLRPFGSVSVEPASEAMSELTLDGETLAICLTDHTAFTAAAGEASLTLTPAAPCDGWQVDGEALALLYRSGVDTLTLNLNDETLDLPTNYEPQGVVYAQLRAEGFTPSEFVWTLTPNGVTAEVDGTAYILQDNRLRLKED